MGVDVLGGGKLGGALGVPCELLHPVTCAQHLHGTDADDLVAVAMEHGARVHGFTPVWYSQDRRDVMVATALRHAHRV